MPTSAEENRIREAARRQAEDDYAAEVEARIAADAARIANARIAELRRSEREAEAAKRREREERELTKQAGKAWRRAFGKRLAAQLGLRTRYWLLRDRGQAWAFTSAEARQAAAEFVETFDRENRVRTGGPVEGIALAGAIGTDRLVAIDPPVSDFEELVAEREKQRLADLRARNGAAAERSRKRRERALFGIELPADDEAEDTASDRQRA